MARYPGSTNPTRRALGEYPTVTLEKARAKAQRWHELIGQGIDPKAEEERLRLAELRKRADTFGAVVDEFASGCWWGPTRKSRSNDAGILWSVSYGRNLVDAGTKGPLAPFPGPMCSTLSTMP